MKGRGNKSFKNCSPRNVFVMFNKLGGFKIKECAKHTKVTHLESGKATTIPRAKKIDRYLLEQNVIQGFLIDDLGFSWEDIFNTLDC